jgi:predicted nucleic acid-binding protein
VGRAVFVDTAFLVAMIDSRDTLHGVAVRVGQDLAASRASLVTSDAVLLELANYFARSPLRSEAIHWISTIRSSRGWEIEPLDRELLRRGEERYREHDDKSWSLTDCTSMVVMRRRRISEVATTDAHFTQAGFRILMGA